MPVLLFGLPFIWQHMIKKSRTHAIRSIHRRSPRRAEAFFFTCAHMHILSDATNRLLPTISAMYADPTAKGPSKPERCHLDAGEGAGSCAVGGGRWAAAHRQSCASNHVHPAAVVGRGQVRVRARAHDEVCAKCLGGSGRAWGVPPGDSTLTRWPRAGPDSERV